MRLRWNRETRAVASYGVRVGYWPCVQGWFIQLNFGTFYMSVWYGEAMA